MSSAAWPALLAGAAVAVAVGLPRPGGLRLAVLLPSRVELAPDGSASSRVLPQGAALGATALLTVGVALVSGSPVGLLVAVAGALAAHLGLRRRRASSARRLERQRAAEACAALATELRAGRSPAEALTTAGELARGPAQSALLAAAASARLGGDVSAALLSGVEAGTTAPEVLRGLAACWQVCARAGSGLAAAVDRLAEGLRSQQAQEQAVQAALAGPRASAAVLAVLPLAGIALAAGLGARPGQVLLHTPVGVGCLVGGLVLDGLGLWWTGRLVDRAGRVR